MIDPVTNPQTTTQPKSSSSQADQLAHLSDLPDWLRNDVLNSYTHILSNIYYNLMRPAKNRVDNHGAIGHNPPMLSPKQLASVIGKRARVEFPLPGGRHIIVACRITNASNAYGNARFEVEPLQGEGRQWVDQKRLLSLTPGVRGIVLPRSKK